MITATPVPGWFHRHRLRILSALSSSGMIGLAIFLVPLATNTPGQVPYSLLLLLSTVSGALLLTGMFTGEPWPIRKGAGMATLAWLAQMGMITSSIVIALTGSGPVLFASVWTAVAGLFIDVLPLFMAGWLYWVAGAHLDRDHEPS